MAGSVLSAMVTMTGERLPQRNHCDVQVTAVMILGAWATYLAGTIPSIYGGDVGELVTSALTLGISHAPGYPLHALFGKAFALLLPWGGPAYRVNLTSAFLTSLTVGCIFVMLRRLNVQKIWAIPAAVLYAFFPIIWDQAQMAEVFALNNAFVVLLLLFAVVGATVDRRTEGASSGKAWALVAFFFGLGLANHQTLLFLAPGLFCLFLWGLWRPTGSFREKASVLTVVIRRRFAAWLVFFTLGLSVYLYLPFRSPSHPPVNFGDPHTFRRFRDVLMRKEFGTLELHPSAIPFRTAGTVHLQLSQFGRQNSRCLGGFALVLGLFGLIWSMKKKPVAADTDSESFLRVFAGAALLSWVLCGPFFALLSNLSPFNTLAQWRLERFLLMPAIFVTIGFAMLLRRLDGLRWLAVLLIAGLAAEQVTMSHPWFRRNLAFRDFGRNLAASMPPRALLVIDRVLFDEPTSCLLNRRLVENQRDDIRVIYRPGTLFELFYGEDVLEIPRAERGGRQKEREQQLWASLDRPLAALAFARDNLPPFSMALNGLPYRRESGPDCSPFYVRRDRMERPSDYPTRLITVHYPYFAAKEALEKDNSGKALIETDHAAWIGNDMEWLRSNLGSLWSQWAARKTGDVAETALRRSRSEFRKSIELDPFFSQGHFGMGYVYLKAGQTVKAIESFAEAVRVRPDWAEAYYMLGLSNSTAGRNVQAREAWQKFLSLDPDSPLAEQLRRAGGLL